MALAPAEGLQSGAAWTQYHEAEAYLRPAITFAGDEQVSEADYVACMTDNWYTQTTPRFVAAGEAFGVPITAERYEREKRVLSAACWFDAWLDEPDVDTARRFADYETIITASLTSDPDKAVTIVGDLTQDARLVAAATLLGNAVQPLANDRREDLAQLGLAIGRLGQQKTTATDALQYRLLATSEGYQTGVLFARALTADMPETLATRQYADWMGKSLGYFTVRDSREDLADDFAEGRTLVKPTVGAKLTLLAGQVALLGDLTSSEAGRRAGRAMKEVKVRLGLPDTH
jgi:hypothetical protein